MTAIQDVGIPCNEFVELVTDYLDGVLAADVVVRIDAHLALCPGCVSVLEQFRETVRLARRIQAKDVERLDPTLRAELMAAFRDATR